MTTVKIKESTLNNIKVLKKFKDVRSYDELISSLVESELKNNYAYTQDGYLPVGSVVLEGDTVLVINKVINGRVIFDDFSYGNNGSKVIYKLRLLSDSIESYGGGRFNV